MPEREKDELDGPLFRVRLDVTAQRFDRAQNAWTALYVAASTQWTLVKRGDTIDVQAAQTLKGAN